MSETPPAANFIDPSALMRIKSLELRARAVVEGFLKGLHRSPYHGFSVEFSEYRQYARGDDPRYIDWKVYARSDRHFIKKFEDETNLRAHFFVDQSRSMNFASGEVRKVDYANTLAATLGHFLSLQGDAIGLTTFHENVAEQLPPRNRPGHLRRFMLMLDQDCRGQATDLAGMLDRIPLLCRKRGLIVLVSDFLVPAAEVFEGLRPLHAAGHDVVLFRVLDPAERDLGRLEKATHFRDAETGREFFVDPETAGNRYQDKLEAHEESVRSVAMGYGMEWISLTTDEPLEGALWSFLNRRQAGAVKARSRRARNR